MKLLPSPRALSLAARLMSALVWVAGSATVARAADAPPPPHAPRTLDEPAIPMLPGLEPMAVAPATDLERVQTDLGKYAFQYYIGNNWEIAIDHSDYSGDLRQLTHDGAPDLEPALSADMARIVFTSRRSGNYDLFRMNSDGSGLVMLTNSGATDSGAAWSPDGQRLAFQSNREGNQYDVYVMNADGGAVTRLTTQSGYDGEPAWSPDGTQIAFVSRRSTGNVDYYLYLMNADGSNQHVLAAVPYTGNPAWSWDGKRILIDGLNADGWQRLYVVDAVTGQTRSLPHFAGEQNVDVLSGSWGVNDRIYFTRAHYVLYNNVWYWDTMDVYISSVDQPTSSGRLLTGGVGAFPSWANPDHWPPTSMLLTERPAYALRSGVVAFDMLVLDQGSAGGAGGQAQYRLDGGGWDSNVSCSSRFSNVVHCDVMGPVGGSLLEYRFRGFDGFYNLEEWPTDPQRWGQLRFYDTLVTGTVYDQTGRPLARVPVTGIPMGESGVQTDLAGRWVAHQIIAGTDFTVTVGSGSSVVLRPESRMTATGSELTGSYYLPPADDVIVNAGFDADPHGWTAGGPAGVEWIDAVDGASGVLRVSLGDTAWAATGVVSAATAAISGTTTLLAYRDGTGNHFQACLGVSGCPVEDLGATTTRDFAVSPDGTVVMVLTNDDGTRSFRQRSPAGHWSPAETFPYMGGGSSHRLLFDHAGSLHYVWAEGDGMVHVAHYQADGSWSGASQAGLMPLGSDYIFDADGVLHMVGCPTHGVVEVTWSEAVGMSLPSTVSSETCDGYHQGTSLDASGHIDTLWSSDGVVRYSRRNADGSWGAPQPAAGLALAAQGSVLGSNQRATVLTVEPATNHLALRQPADGGVGWSTLGATLPKMGADSTRRFLALNVAAGVALFSEAAVGGREVNAYPTDAAAVAPSITQIVTLPAPLHRPLLSVAYRNPLANTDDSVALTVQGPGQAQPTLFALTPGLAWQRDAFDVSAWVGQTITVSVRLVDGGAPNELALDLDEVHLGSWTTPVVGTSSPTVLDAPTGSFTLVGDNFYGAPVVTVGGLPAVAILVDAQHLSLTAPAGLTYGRHAIVVVNPDGTTAAASAPLVVGRVQLTLPAVLRHAVPRWP